MNICEIQSVLSGFSGFLLGVALGATCVNAWWDALWFSYSASKGIHVGEIFAPEAHKGKP